MKHILQMLLYENGGLSLTRVIALTFVLLFVFVTLFDMTWGHFETLAAMATGGGPATQIANKLINSKYNSELGSYKQREGAE